MYGFDEESAPLLAAPHYYFSVCGLCQNTATANSALKRCSRCKVMFYCSSDHQKIHWKHHKLICNYLSNAKTEGEQEHFFSGHCDKSREEWNMFRMNAVKTCSIILSRPLELSEQEMFLFPRVCRTPGCYSPVPGGGGDSMAMCEQCQCTVWCSHQHWDEAQDQHQQVCRQLRLARIADRYESQVRVGMPSLPCHLDREYMGTAPDISHFLDTPFEGEGVKNEELDYAFLTNQLSGPLTLLDIGHKHVSNFGTRDSLTINIAGANVYEVMGLIKWEYLAHRLPALKELALNFIGPELEPEEGDHGVTVGQCDECTNIGRVVSYNMFNMTYSQFRSMEESSAHPDLVIVQNCGFHEYDVETYKWREGWSTLSTLLHPSTPLIFTSYTKGEADKDLRRFLEYCEAEVEILMKCEENPMRSHRPIRDWELDQDKDSSKMDLAQLPDSTYKMRTVDQKQIIEERKEYWESLFAKFEDMDEQCTETESIHEIGDPFIVAKREETFRHISREIPSYSSKTFRRWFKEHGEEIDELTTIAGPPAQDEEDIGDEFDDDSSEDDYETMEESEGDFPPSEGHESNNVKDDDKENEDYGEESDSDLELLLAIPKSLQLSSSLTPIKQNRSINRISSPKISLATPNKSRLDESQNLSCASCGDLTNYSVDMGIKETNFECDDCLLSVHSDCVQDCQLCKDVAGKVAGRWKLKTSFLNGPK